MEQTTYSILSVSPDDFYSCNSAEVEMIKEHHRLNGHEFGQTLGDNEGQGSLACCSPQGHNESEPT